jgi:hypothetical protein
MTWEAAKEAVCAATAATPPPPQQPKAEEPFRPGLPPAELRAVCKEWEWRGHGARADTRFDGDKHWFVEFGEGNAMRHTVTIRDNFRPLGRTWADVEAAAKATKANDTSSSRLPKEGDVVTVASAVAVVREGCRQALDDLLPSYDALCAPPTARQSAKVGNYAAQNYTPRRTFIIASPPGRRKYVKLLLKRLGYRNVDKIPTTDKQTPFDLGRSLPDHERENLLAIAPGIVLRDTL